MTTNQRLQRECVDYLLLKSDLLYNKVTYFSANLLFAVCAVRLYFPAFFFSLRSKKILYLTVNLFGVFTKIIQSKIWQCSDE